MADAEDQSQKYDQAFFLTLAAKGKDAWNAWRRDPANKDVRVTFAGSDFSRPPRDQITFEGIEFGDLANFSGCKWRGISSTPVHLKFEPGRAYFNQVVFGSNCKFTDATFGDCAYFVDSVFCGSVDFTRAIFGRWAVFSRTRFRARAVFNSAVFGDRAAFIASVFWLEATFEGSIFGREATFRKAVFHWPTKFTGAAFGDGADFSQAKFAGLVEFTGKSEEQQTGDLAGSPLKKRYEDAWKLYGSGPNRFLSASFANARFDGEADFSGRSFEQAGDFANARFFYPPNFDAETNASRIDFTGAHIGFVLPGKRLHWTVKSRIPVRLRALRKIAEETKNHDLERDLCIEERKAERGIYLFQRLVDLIKEPVWNWPVNAGRLITHFLWIAVMGVYWALADYGRSFARPAAWLIASVFFFYWRYTEVLAPLMAKAGPPDGDKYKQAVRMLALGNAVPFVGPLTIDAEIKRFLFCPGGDGHCLPIPPEGYQLLVVGQNFFSITCVFFIGLALRNYFKIK